MFLNTNIVVSIQYEATHCWPDCPYEDVNFLQYPHLHIFHIECKKAVTHNDRDIEIIRFARKIRKHLNDTYNGDLGRRSCEMLAEELILAFKLQYCCVREDGVHGAEVYAS